jgi:PBP1b-binding outer membrane lipoprotein LpoB
VSRSNIVILFLIVILGGCSYSPKSYVIPQEDLAKYNPKDFSTKSKISFVSSKSISDNFNSEYSQ